MSISPQDTPSLDLLLSEEQAKMRKLQIIFGAWWRHYAVPYEFRWTLYTESDECPYCGGALGDPPTTATDNPLGSAPHLDHMDPLSKGGEESIRNAVYVCAQCNLAKGSQLFMAWLEKVPAERQETIRTLYQEKHGHPPEGFQRTGKTERLSLPRVELQLPEAVLRRLYPRPIVSGPPEKP